MRLVFLPLSISCVCSLGPGTPWVLSITLGDVSRYRLAPLPPLVPLIHDEFLWGQNDLLFMLDRTSFLKHSGS